MGLAVHLPQGQVLGILKDIQWVAGQELWFVHDAADNEILIPAVDSIVVDIDIQGQCIIIDPPPGLVELYQQK